MKKTISLLLAVLLTALSGCGAKSGSTQKITSPDDLASMRVGVVTGTSGADYALAHYSDATRMEFNSVVDMVAALQAGKVDCIISDWLALAPIAGQDSSLALYPEKLTQEEYSIAVKKGNSALLEQLNTFVDEAKQNGTLDEICKRWVEEQDYRQPDIPSSGENGVIKVGIGNNIPMPSAGMVDGKIVGIGPELSYRFAAKYGYTLEIVYVEFGALIPALESGKIDFVSSDMVIKPERAERVDFTLPYNQGGLAIMAKKERFE